MHITGRLLNFICNQISMDGVKRGCMLNNEALQTSWGEYPKTFSFLPRGPTVPNVCSFIRSLSLSLSLSLFLSLTHTHARTRAHAHPHTHTHTH